MALCAVLEPGAKSRGKTGRKSKDQVNLGILGAASQFASSNKTPVSFIQIEIALVLAKDW